MRKWSPEYKDFKTHTSPCRQGKLKILDFFLQKQKHPCARMWETGWGGVGGTGWGGVRGDWVNGFRV